MSAKSYALDVAKRVFMARTERGFTREQLSELCGWSSVSRIANLEQALREPHLRHLEIICEVLDIPIGWVLFGSHARHVPLIRQPEQLESASYKINYTVSEIEKSYSNLSKILSTNNDEKISVEAHLFDKNLFCVSVYTDDQGMDAFNTFSINSQGIALISQKSQISHKKPIFVYNKTKKVTQIKKSMYKDNQLYISNIHDSSPCNDNIYIIGPVIKILQDF